MPWEMSHYRKFQQIANGEVTLPDIYPMRANPSSADLEGPVRRLSELCDACYTLILTSLEKSFNSTDTPSFFRVAFPVMQVALPSLATLLMQTSLLPPADPTLGPTAGPEFAYRPQPLADMAAEATHLLAHPPDLGPGYRQLWTHGVGRAAEALAGALAPEQDADLGGKP